MFQRTVKLQNPATLDMSESLLLVGVMGLVMAAATTVTLLLYRTLEGSGEQAMVKMRLHSDETYQEFKALKWGHLIQAVGLITLAAGAAYGYQIGIMIGRISTLIQGTITISVIARWWGRFQ